MSGIPTVVMAAAAVVTTRITVMLIKSFLTCNSRSKIKIHSLLMKNGGEVPDFTSLI
jgi:hypothetical protein